MPRLGSSVIAFRALGWSSTAIGAVGIAVVAAFDEHPGRFVLVSLAIAAIVAAPMWLLRTREMPGTPIAPPAGSTVAPDGETVRRALLLQVAFAALIAVVVLLAPSPVGVVLGIGLWQLATATRLRRWERTNERRLLSEHRWSSPHEFYTR
jgi:hypothetical protein